MQGKLVAAIGTLLLASAARADHTSLHATADGEVVTTDNLYAAGSGFLQRPDMFFTVRPGVLYAYDAPQMVHDFTADAEVVGYLSRSDKPIVTGRAAWRSQFLPTPRTSLGMAISAGTGLLSLLSTRLSPDETTATVTPSGRIDVQQTDTSQSMSWISSKHTRIQQGLVGRYGFTDDGSGTTAETRDVGGNLGFERTFRRDTVALDASVRYVQFERIAPVGAELSSRLDHQINPRGVATWRHDIDKRWSTNVDGGVVFVNPIGTDKYNPGLMKRAGTFAVFGGQVSYVEPWGRAMLSARRNVEPNLFLAQNTVNNEANLQLAMPLTWLGGSVRRPKVAVLSSVGFAHTQLIDAETGGPKGNFQVAHADASLGWTPQPGQTYGVRYELVYQTGDEAAQRTAPAFVRNTLYVTFSLRYPARIAGEVPKRKKGMRSDGKDMMSGGAEVVPDILDEGGQDDLR
jgi:hypothetical protein